MCLKVSSAKRRSFCLCLNVLKFCEGPGMVAPAVDTRWHVSSFNLLIWNFVYFQVCFLHLMRIVTITLTSRRWLVGYQPVVEGPWRRGRNVSHGGSFQLMLWWCKPVSVSHIYICDVYIYIYKYIYTCMWNLNLVVIMPTIRLLQCPGNQCCLVICRDVLTTKLYIDGFAQDCSNSQCVSNGVTAVLH